MSREVIFTSQDPLLYHPLALCRGVEMWKTPSWSLPSDNSNNLKWMSSSSWIYMSLNFTLVEIDFNCKIEYIIIVWLTTIKVKFNDIYYRKEWY